MQDLLIADDDSGVRSLLEKLFANDFQLHMARDGTEAMAMLSCMTPAAILVDEMMPGATGTDVLERAKHLHPDVPRVLMTAMGDPRFAVAAVNRGEAHRFYTKPLRVAELRRAVLDLVHNAQADASLKVELAALRDQRADLAQGPRILVLGSGDNAEMIAHIAAQQGCEVDREERLDRMANSLMQGHDVVVLVRGPHVDVRPLASLAHTVDEATAVVVVDAEPDLASVTLSLEAGACDYWAGRLDHATVLPRLARAVEQPRKQRDLRTLTVDLLAHNRTLLVERERAQADQIKLLHGLVRAIEAREGAGAGHTERVTALSVRVAICMHMAPVDVEVVRVGALLHDIGKLGVRDDVLLKPGALTSDEFDLVKRHPVIGADILAGIDSFACHVPYVRSHHEKLDGTGYPDRIAASTLPLGVRVLSAADCLDAITSTRPHRRGTPIERAFEILDRMSGNHLDPDVVAVLHDLHNRGELVSMLQPPDA
jgi:putative nucleotidyltransferase with HDIG domain